MLLTRSLINCKSTSPGLSRLWVTNWEDLLPFLIFGDYGYIVDIDKDLIWFEIKVSPEDTYTERLVNNNTGKSYTQSAEVFYPFGEIEDEETLRQLTCGKFVAIVKDNSGRYVIFGIESPVELDEYSDQSGAKGGKRGYNFNFKSSSYVKARIVNGGYIDENILTAIACPTMAYSEVLLGNALDCPVY